MNHEHAVFSPRLRRGRRLTGGWLAGVSVMVSLAVCEAHLPPARAGQSIAGTRHGAPQPVSHSYLLDASPLPVRFHAGHEPGPPPVDPVAFRITAAEAELLTQQQAESVAGPPDPVFDPFAPWVNSLPDATAYDAADPAQQGSVPAPSAAPPEPPRAPRRLLLEDRLPSARDGEVLPSFELPVPGSSASFHLPFSPAHENGNIVPPPSSATLRRVDQ